MKKIFSLVICLLISLLLAVNSYAVNKIVQININGQDLKLSHSPIIEGTKTYVPAIELFQGLGINSTWETSRSTAIIERGDIRLQISIGQKNAILNDFEISLNSEPKMIDGVFMVPIDVITDTFSIDLYFNKYENLILINENLELKYDSTGSFVEYEAQLTDSKPNGFGRQYRKDGTLIYEGQYKRGVRDGIGTIYWTNGNKYLGQIKNNKIDGTGQLEYIGIGTYQGHFVNGLKDGTGIFSWNNGEQYSGSWKNDMLNGNGTYLFKNGDEYIGKWLNNKMHGSGTYKFKNGKIFKGIWNKGIKTGGAYVD